MNRVLFAFLLFVVSYFPGKAAVDFFGGSLTYSHVGSGVYHIYLDVFLDCSGDTLTNDTLFLNRQGGYQGSIALLASARQKLWEKDITGLGDSCTTQSKCSSGSFAYGFKRVMYRYEVDLSADSACHFNLYWEKYTWSNTITTGSANREAILFAEINRCTSDVSSPQFPADPRILLMKNADEALNFGASHTQADSLSYALTPTIHLGGTIPGPWNYQNPLSYFGFPNANLALPAGFHINSNTGLVQFRPTALNQVAIVSVEAKSWKRVNGVMQLISQAYRYQGVVIGATDTTNAMPYMLPIGSSNANGCLGDTLRVRYGLYDADSTQHLRVISLSSLEDMTWSVDYAQSPPVLTVQWVPDSANSIHNTNYYHVNFVVEDDHCPLPKRQTRTITFGVSFRPAADVHLSDSLCGYVSLSVQNVQNTVGMGWYMDGGLNQSISNPPRLLPGTHTSIFRLGGYQCNVYFYDTFTIKPYGVPDLSVNPQTYCAHTTAPFFSGVDSAFGGSTYTWNWKGTTTQNTQGSITIPLDSGYLYLSVLDSIGCETHDSLKIRLFEDWGIATGLDTILCTNDPYLVHEFLDSHLQWMWWDSTSNDSTFAYQSGTYWLEATDSNGCSRRDSFDIILNPIPDPDLGADANICHSDSVQLDAGAGYVAYYWSDGDTSQMRWISGNASLQVYVEDQNGCLGSDTVVVGRFSPSLLNLGNDTLLCWTDSVLLDAGTFSSWLWNDGNTSGQRWVDQAGTYSVTGTDSNSCYSVDTVVISIHKPQVTIAGDTLFCTGDSVELSLLQTYPLVVWSTGDTADYTYVDATGMSYVFITDSLGCSNGAGYYVWEIPLPSASFTYSDLGGRQIRFNAADTLMEFTWIFGDGDSSVMDDPLHTYPAYQNYQVELFVVDVYGCENSTTQTISFGTGMGSVEGFSLNVYPNPSNGTFFIDWQGEAKEVRVIDQVGKQVAVFHLEEGTKTYSLNLAPGVYMLMDAQGGFEPVRIQVIK
ncbi:MAG TPA: hypothetical protein DIW47_00575 [Bacteroidetes bacterium]|nr:hypothetical protein [Bacteroidota bacterium]